MARLPFAALQELDALATHCAEGPNVRTHADCVQLRVLMVDPERGDLYCLDLKVVTALRLVTCGCKKERKKFIL